VSDPSRDHLAAIQYLLEDSTPYPVYAGEVTAPDSELQLPYLVIWAAPASRLTVTLAGYGGEAHAKFQVTVVGRDIAETLAAADRCTAALHRKHPLIEGRNTSLISHLPGGPDIPRRDETVRINGRPVFSVPVFFSFTSTPQE